MAAPVQRRAIAASRQCFTLRQTRLLANRAHLFVFVTKPGRAVYEQHLRPSVIFRKVTNGFRCEWGAETYAAFRSVVSTAKANGASVLDTVRLALAAKLFVEPTGSRRATPTNLFQHRAGHPRRSFHHAPRCVLGF